MAARKEAAAAINGSRCNCTALRKATRRISQLYDTALAPSGLKTTQRAILAQLGSGLNLREAVILSKAYVTKAIERSYSIGKGAGPLNQLFRFNQEQATRGVHEVPQHGMHPAAEPASH